MNGSLILLTVEDPGLPGTYQAIASTRDASWSETLSLIDESSKDQSYFVGSAGQRQVTFSIGGLYVPADVGLVEIKDAIRNRVACRLERSEDGDSTQIENMLCICTDLSVDAPDQDAATFTAEFTGIGDWIAAA